MKLHAGTAFVSVESSIRVSVPGMGPPGVTVSTEVVDPKKLVVVTHAYRDGALLPVKVASIGQSVDPSAWVCCQLYAWGAACPQTLPATLPITTMITDRCRLSYTRVCARHSSSNNNSSKNTRTRLFALFADEDAPGPSVALAERRRRRSTDRDRPRILVAVALVEHAEEGRVAVLKSICINPMRQRQGYGGVSIEVLQRYMYPAAAITHWFLVGSSERAKRFFVKNGWVVESDFAGKLGRSEGEQELAQLLFDERKRDKNALVYSLV